MCEVSVWKLAMGLHPPPLFHTIQCENLQSLVKMLKDSFKMSGI